MSKKIQVKRVKTIWGKLCFVRASELSDSTLDHIHVCNQFGDNKKMPPPKGMFELAPATVYRENLALN